MNNKGSPIIFILGAGASKSFGVPDLQGFYEEFKKEIIRKKEDLSLVEKLEQHRKGEADLETLITDLRNIQSANETFGGVASVPPDFVTYATDAKLLHDRLISFIIKKCEKFDEQRAVRAYRPILELSNLKPVWIFTTNYDRILEYSCEMCSIPFSDGFVKQAEDLYLWKDKFDQQLCVAKIHGSVNWFRDESSPSNVLKLEEPHPFPTSEFRIGYKGYSFSPSIIIPTFEKYITELPFIALQTRLIDAIRSAKVCFVIGTRLRDSHVKNLLLMNLDNMIVICIGHSPESLLQLFNNHSNVLLLKCGFEQFAMASTGYLSELMQKIETGNVREVIIGFIEKVRQTMVNLEKIPSLEGGTIDELINRLSSLNYAERANAARRLGESGVRTATSRLLPLLDDASEYVRIQAVGALTLLQAEEALPKFRDLLFSDMSEDVRVEVALALSKFMNQTAAGILEEASSLTNLTPYLQKVITYITGGFKF